MTINYSTCFLEVHFLTLGLISLTLNLQLLPRHLACLQTSFNSWSIVHALILHPQPLCGSSNCLHNPFDIIYSRVSRGHLTLCPFNSLILHTQDSSRSRSLSPDSSSCRFHSPSMSPTRSSNSLYAQVQDSIQSYLSPTHDLKNLYPRPLQVSPEPPALPNYHRPGRLSTRNLNLL